MARFQVARALQLILRVILDSIIMKAVEFKLVPMPKGALVCNSQMPRQLAI